MFLTIAGLANVDTLIGDLYSWCNTVTEIWRARRSGGKQIKRLRDAPFRKETLEFLKRFDPTILDIKVVGVKNSIGDDSAFFLFLIRELEEGGERVKREFPLETESSGTRTLLRTYFSLRQAIETNGLCVVDDIETNLHPFIVREIIKLFHERTRRTRAARFVRRFRPRLLRAKIPNDARYDGTAF